MPKTFQEEDDIAVAVSHQRRGRQMKSKSIKNTPFTESGDEEDKKMADKSSFEYFTKGDLSDNDPGFR